MGAFNSAQGWVSYLILLYLSVSIVSSDPSNIMGIPCENNSSCEIFVGSFCDQTASICRCKTGTFANPGESICLSLIGQPCTENQQCVGHDSNSSVCLIGSSPKLCDCRARFVQNFDLTDCLPIRDSLGEHCIESIQCQRGAPGNFSSCLNHSCQCNPNTVPVDVNTTTNLPATCMLTAVQVGGPCENDLQCTTNLGSSRCNGNVCVCSENHVNASSRCLPAKSLSEDCVESVQCTALNSECTGTGGLKCTCKNGYVNVIGENTCLAKVSIGQSCENSVQCPDTSTCTLNKKCECSQGYIPSASNVICLKLAELLDETCIEQSQCKQLANSECVNGKCKCSPGRYIPLDTKLCAPIVREINVPCMDIRQCVEGLGANSLCDNKYCQCTSSYMYSHGKCVIPAKLDQPCITVEQCYAGVNNLTECTPTNADTQKRCRCIPEAIPFGDNKKCYDRNKKIDESCDSNDECSVSISGDVYCSSSSKTCKCRTGSKPNSTNNICTSDGIKNQVSFVNFLVIAMIGNIFKYFS